MKRAAKILAIGIFAAVTAFAARDRDDAVQAAVNAANAILIRLEPGNDATEAFLAGEGTVPVGDGGITFPPDAFQWCVDGGRRNFFWIRDAGTRWTGYSKTPTSA